MLDVLLGRYNSLLHDINIGYPIKQEAINELMDLLAKMYLVYYEDEYYTEPSSLAKEILEYYG